ncbi:MAG: efflux RND transporter periplasmic adaptor subunit [Kofleriaceae bacterium]|nr:efflux RND transporter periplasmic adaptor subunit [Kofleriaceae bacterium]MCL4225786.1 efflux RND transporter periplasmic adaptor subunit [Myxococcales bacterium]
MKPITSSRSPLGRSVAGIARRVVPFVVLAGLAVGGYLGWRAWKGGPPPLTYTTSEVERGAVVQSITASGTLSPVVRSTVGSQVSGRITEILVDFNDEVKAGQVLARLDTRLLAGQVSQAKARLASARAELTRAQANAENARITHERTAALLPSGAVSQAEVDAARAARLSAEAAIQTARSSIVEAQAALENATTNLAYTTITSPIDGVVISRSVDAGQTVAASLQAPELFVIAGDLSKMELHAAVAEADVGQLRDGMKVELAFDAYPERTFTGTVRQVRNQATTTSNVVTYDALVAIDNSDGALRPGMTATATFLVAEARDVLVVPTKALRYRPSRPAAETGGATADVPRAENGDRAGRRRGGRSPAVWVLRDGKPARVAVEAGLTDGTSTAITGGELREGDLVVTADSQQSSTGGAPGRNGTNRTTSTRRGPPALF